MIRVGITNGGYSYNISLLQWAHVRWYPFACNDVTILPENTHTDTIIENEIHAKSEILSPGEIVHIAFIRAMESGIDM